MRKPSLSRWIWYIPLLKIDMVFNMKELLIIGIDSLDPDIIVRLRENLPNLTDAINDSPTFRSHSVFPVDTIPAWATITTGQNPTSHGILYSYDVFDQSLNGLKELDFNQIKGKTFWEILSDSPPRTWI